MGRKSGTLDWRKNPQVSPTNAIRVEWELGDLEIGYLLLMVCSLAEPTAKKRREAEKTYTHLYPHWNSTQSGENSPIQSKAVSYLLQPDCPTVRMLQDLKTCHFSRDMNPPIRFGISRQKLCSFVSCQIFSIPISLSKVFCRLRNLIFLIQKSFDQSDIYGAQR